MSALTSIAKILTQLFDFLWNLILDLFKIIDMLSAVVLDLPVLLDMFLPPSVAGLFIVCVSITVIYRVAGRD